MDCIFCKIIEGEIPSYKVYEDENVFAFLDITQGTKGHTLIIPKEHIKNVYDLTEEMAENIFKVVPKIARALKTAFNPIGINIISNNELVPRYENDGMELSTVNNYGKFSEEYFMTLVKDIKENL